MLHSKWRTLLNLLIALAAAGTVYLTSGHDWAKTLGTGFSALLAIHLVFGGPPDGGKPDPQDSAQRKQPEKS